MPDPPETYSYRAGKKIRLRKKADQFVVRATPEEAKAHGFAGAERMSSHSSRVTVRAPDLERAMTEARLVAPTHHAYEIAGTREEFLITDRIFVTFREPLTPEQLDDFVGRNGLVTLETYSDKEYLFQLTDHTGVNPIKLVVRLMEKEPLVETADHDLNYRATPAQPPVPADARYSRQWHLHTHFADPAFDPRASARVEDSWSILGNYGNLDTVVAIADDGCKLDHADFDSPAKFAGWGYFQGLRLVVNTDVDADRARMYTSGSNHGTSCAGVVAAEIDGALTVGAAPGCRLLPIKWESDGPSLFISDSKLRTALDFVADKVDVMSNSWGIVPTSVWSPIVVSRLGQLAKTGGRRGKGILFLFAAGNENCPIQHEAAVDVPYTDGWNTSGASAVWVGVETTRHFENNLVGLPGVLHVAALSSHAQRSHYSNYGTGIALCAPTSNGHEYHRATVKGLGITTTTGPGSGVTTSFGGTSSATPLTAGIAALVISANPDLTAFQVASILKRTASKDLRMTGYGRTPPANFDANTSWDVSPIAPFDNGAFSDIGSAEGTWSPWFGHGRVDAAAAVTEARTATVAPVADTRFEANVAKPIPDNKPVGVRSVIVVPASTDRIQKVKVTVDISHSWIGDLRITLTGPSGKKVLLHDRKGAGQNDIKQTYEPGTLPGLASFKDQDVEGDWVLEVQDLAERDVGTVHTWALDFELAAGPLLVRDETMTMIPDNDPAGVVRILDVPAGHIIQDVAVSVDITHPYTGDLLVTLAPPNSDSIPLHSRAGWDADNLRRTWRTGDLPGLQALRGHDAAGKWTLKVADLAGRDVGKLNRWSVEISS